MSRLRIFLILTLLIAAAVFSVTRLRFSANIYDLLPPELPEVQGMDRLNRHFSQDRILILTLEADDGPQAESAASSLAEVLLARDDIVSRVVRELPLEEMAGESSGLVAWLWFNGESEALSALAERLREGSSAGTIAESLTAIEEGFLNEETVIQSYDPLGLLDLPGALDFFDSTAGHPLSSEDGAFRVLHVERAGPPALDYRLTARWLENLHAAVQGWQAANPAFDKVEIGLTGTPAFMAAIGSRMERDLSGSLLLTTVLIALLFAVMHRRLQPLLWLVALLLLILCAALNLGSLLVGNLSVMSAGFAAILTGLAVDYGVVLYREARSATSAPQLRRQVGPAILWAAATTAAVFLSLNFSSLPGLAQLGNLVALGVAIGAAVMLLAFSPLATRFPPPARTRHDPTELLLASPGARLALLLALVVPAAALISVGLLGGPALDPEFRPFRISSAPAFRAWRHMQSRLAREESLTPLIVTGDSHKSLREQVARARRRLEEAQEAGLLARFALPAGLIPDRERQVANAAAVRRLVPEGGRLLGELEAAGFSEEGTRLTREMFDRWSEFLVNLDTATEAIMPSGLLADFALGRLLSVDQETGEHAFLGTVAPVERRNRAWIAAICDDTTSVASLGALGTALNQRIESDLRRVFMPLMAVLALMLLLVFRSWRDLLLSLFSLLFAAAAVLLLTLWSPLGWNAFNLCAIPILFGTGLDYGIHMIFALRRNRGDLARTRDTIGKALLFCGGSTAIGFGTLGFASARGLASFGQICAAGILVNMMVAVWLLPHWWRWMHQPRKKFQSTSST